MFKTEYFQRNDFQATADYKYKKVKIDERVQNSRKEYRIHNNSSFNSDHLYEKEPKTRGNPIKSGPRKFRFCNFCYKNKEPPYVYDSHILKNENGIITCPVLRKYVCPICGVHGNHAHTVNYCPKRRTPSKEKNLTQFSQIKPNGDINLQEDFFGATSSSYSNTSAPRMDSKDRYDKHGYCFPQGNFDFQTKPKFRESAFPHSSKRKLCTFCKNSNRPCKIYMGHSLKGRKGSPGCPFLKVTVCEDCGNKGHTKSYCPNKDFEELFSSLKI